jgi:hypothetical protein
LYQTATSHMMDLTETNMDNSFFTFDQIIVHDLAAVISSTMLKEERTCVLFTIDASAQAHILVRGAQNGLVAGHRLVHVLQSVQSGEGSLIGFKRRRVKTKALPNRFLSYTKVTLQFILGHCNFVPLSREASLFLPSVYKYSLL